MSSCSPRIVYQDRTVTVHDTVRVEVPTVHRYADDWAGRTCRALDSLCSQTLLQESQLGLCILDLTEGRVLYEHGARQRMRPASTMKVVTAVTAMDALLDHPDAFALRCYRTLNSDSDSKLKTQNSKPKTQKSASSLILVGGMDPLLCYTDLCALADTLVARGLTQIGDISLDVSLADTTRWGEGWCWDDENEARTPFLYVSERAARGGRGSSRLAWRQLPEQPFIDDLRRAFKSRRITVSGTIRRTTTRPAPADGTAELVTRISHTWDDVLWPMMKNSNNQYAESMLWQLGLLADAPCPRLSRIDDAFESLCSRLHLNAYNYRIADGSGRSLYNYVTPELLCVLLNHAATQPWFERLRSSLPVMGVDGTLRRRCHGTTAHNRVFAKTGTVTGVSSLAGYAMSGEGHLLCFAIINQGIRDGALGRAFQDEVCQVLTR